LTTLRPYQDKLIENSRVAMRSYRRILIQLATGGGKTVIFTQIVQLCFEKSKKINIWIMVPRNELLRQCSQHLKKRNLPHATIAAGSHESRAFRVHIVSKDTLIRRYDKIRRWPDVLIIDEAHLFIERQLEIINHMPPKTRVIGFSATPERLDGRGLNIVYNIPIFGPPMVELVNQGFLCGLKYFCPPIEGLRDVHRVGTEYKADDLDKFLKKRKIYGRAIDHYRKYADKKSCLIFCRSIKAAEETAELFRNAGYNFECIDGTMTYRKREMILNGLKDGRLHGLTSVDLVTYGLDVPRVECIIMLRPTLSRTLFFQMIGRGLRPYFDKPFCVILDHVGNLQEHGHPFQPYDWKFSGVEKRKRKKNEENPDGAQLCTKCWMHYTGNSCPNCGEDRKKREQKKIELVDTELVQTSQPVNLNELPLEERREYVDRINGAVDEFAEMAKDGIVNTQSVTDLIKISMQLGYSINWVYWKLSGDSLAVNMTLLHEIGRQRGYQSGWPYMQRKRILKQMNQKRTQKAAAF